MEKAEGLELGRGVFKVWRWGLRVGFFEAVTWELRVEGPLAVCPEKKRCSRLREQNLLSLEMSRAWQGWPYALVINSFTYVEPTSRSLQEYLRKNNCGCAFNIPHCSFCLEYTFPRASYGLIPHFLWFFSQRSLLARSLSWTPYFSSFSIDHPFYFVFFFLI